MSDAAAIALPAIASPARRWLRRYGMAAFGAALILPGCCWPRRRR